MTIDFKNMFKNYKPYINSHQNYQLASVLIPIVLKDNKEHILFEVRSSNLKSQPCEISFPGGKHEVNEDPKYCAIRETHEELGVNIDNIDIITELNLFIAPFNLIIHPYLGYLAENSFENINKDEVDHVFLVPLDFLLNTTPLVYTNEVMISVDAKFPYDLIPNKQNYKFKKGKYPSIFYIYNDYVIWGLTAQILKDFLDFVKYSQSNK